MHRLVRRNANHQRKLSRAAVLAVPAEERASKKIPFRGLAWLGSREDSLAAMLSCRMPRSTASPLKDDVTKSSTS